MFEFLKILSLIFTFYQNYWHFYVLPPKKLTNKHWSLFAAFKATLVRSGNPYHQLLLATCCDKTTAIGSLTGQDGTPPEERTDVNIEILM